MTQDLAEKLLKRGTASQGEQFGCFVVKEFLHTWNGNSYYNVTCSVCGNVSKRAYFQLSKDRRIGRKYCYNCYRVKAVKVERREM